MISFVVPGIAQPKGSTRAFVRRGAPMITADNPKARGWQGSIAWTARQIYGAREAMTGPVSVSVWFYFERPPHQRPIRVRPTVKPDLDKLLRCACDALTGIVYADDAQVVNINAWKYYSQSARAEFLIREVANGADEIMQRPEC